VQVFLRTAGCGSWQLLRMIDSERVLQRWLDWLAPLGRSKELDEAGLWQAVERETLRKGHAHAASYAAAHAGDRDRVPHDREASAAARELRALWLRLAGLQGSAPAMTACLVTAYSYESQANWFPEEERA
jgi:hypothetical protein